MSYDYGKDSVCKWVRQNFNPERSLILDVGPYDGKWHYLLPEYKMDGVEIFKQNYDNLKGLQIYKNLYFQNVKFFEYYFYDLIIFGDVIEHMTPEDAKAVLDYAWPKCKDMIVAVPFLYKQGAIYGNPYEIHIQDDLTFDLFNERYPGFSVLCRPTDDYCYFHKAEAI